MSGSIFATPTHSAEKAEKTSQEAVSSSINILILMRGILDRLELRGLKEDQEREEDAIENWGTGDAGGLYEDQNKNGQYPQLLEGREDLFLEGRDPSLLEGGEDLTATLDYTKHLPEGMILGIRVGDYMVEGSPEEIGQRLMETPPDKVETLRRAFEDPGSTGIREPITLSVNGEVKYHQNATTPILEETVSVLNEGFEQCFDGPGPHEIQGEKFVITKLGDNLSIAARDGRGTILDVKAGVIHKSELQEPDMLRIQIGNDMIRRHPRERPQLVPGWDPEIKNVGTIGEQVSSRDIGLELD